MSKYSFDPYAYIPVVLRDDRQVPVSEVCSELNRQAAEIERLREDIHCERDILKQVQQERDQLKAIIEKMEDSLNKCVEAVENTAWGWDGDCGLESRINYIADGAIEYANQLRQQANQQEVTND